MNIDTNQLDKLFKKTDKEDEFEVIFSQLSLEKYMSVMKYINNRSKAHKLTIDESNVLDVSYSEFIKNDVNNAVRTTYRISINGLENINKYLSQFAEYNSHVVFTTLLKLKDKSISIMKKTKESENLIEIPDYEIRIRKSAEENVTEKEIKKLLEIDHTVPPDSIFFRLKQRTSLMIKKNLRIDVTSVKSNRKIKFIPNSNPTFELEVEYTKNKAIDIKIDDVLKETELLIKILQQSNYIISKSEEKMIINAYKKISDSDNTATVLNGRKPESLEIQYLTDTLPNKYAVTDKADGDRNFLIIINKKVYLISNNLRVKDIGITLKTDKYNNSILDGEYIFIPKKNRHLFMVFDCLFNGNTDVRKLDSLMERLNNAQDIISNCFVFGKQKGYEYKDYNLKDKEFNLDKRIGFHEKQIKEYIDALNHDIDIEKKIPLIRKKYFIAVEGAKPWEISRYASLLWNKYTNDSNIQCPYILDGLIFQPLQQNYEASSSKSKYADYKWKPPTKNSIDFYIEFIRDKKTNKIMSVYDNSISIDDFVAGQPYFICHLYVGNRNKYTNSFEPVLFREKDNAYICNLYSEKGKVFDIEGNIINDKTIVEFYYNNDVNLDEKFKWTPIRTRYDKTQQMQQYHNTYGNYTTVADKVWRSMVNPILITDFDDLAKGDAFYEKKLQQLRSKISFEIIASTNKENKYFQNVEKLVYSMTQYHNFIKSVLIYTHSNKQYAGGKPRSVLEIAYGRGSDNNRYFYVQVEFLVATDIDADSLISSSNGAKSRYEYSKKTKPNVPRMFFVQADAGSLLNFDDQNLALKGMTQENKYFMDKFFSKDKSKRTTFDRMNCNFAIHYMFKSDDTWNNLKENINDYLKPGGIFSFTTSDARSIIKLLKDKDSYASYFTTKDGEKKKLWEYVKKYDDKISSQKMIGTGFTVDFYASWLFVEGEYKSEYLVDKEFVVKELSEIGLELIDTDTFENFMTNNRDFMTNAIKYESVDATKKFLQNAGSYYERTPLNIACYPHTNLFRYYVFRKKESNESKKGYESKKKQKGGFINTDILDKSEFIIPKVKSTTDSFHDSIHYILKSHKLIPATLSQKDFNKEFSELKNGFELYHDDGKNKIKIIDGLTFMIVEHDCNKQLDYDKIENGKTNKAVILYKQGSKYSPVYKIESNGKRGIFNVDDGIITKMKSEI